MLFVYAPAGFAAMLAFAVAVAASVVFLRNKSLWFDALAVSATEIGLIFLTVNLAAGVVWSYRTRDIWWTWDPAVASALVCGLVYASYLMLRRAVEEPSQRATFSAVWSIFCFTDAPFVAAAVYRWRALHPHPVLWADVVGGWQAPLAASTAATLALAAVLLVLRLRQQNALRERESARRIAQAM
jgi:heme exporter protein C